MKQSHVPWVYLFRRERMFVRRRGVRTVIFLIYKDEEMHNKRKNRWTDRRSECLKRKIVIPRVH